MHEMKVWGETQKLSSPKRKTLWPSASVATQNRFSAITKYFATGTQRLRDYEAKVILLPDNRGCTLSSEKKNSVAQCLGGYPKLLFDDGVKNERDPN